jgi:hypothetical protein
MYEMEHTEGLAGNLVLFQLQLYCVNHTIQNIGTQKMLNIMEGYISMLEYLQLVEKYNVCVQNLCANKIPTIG